MIAAFFTFRLIKVSFIKVKTHHVKSKMLNRGRRNDKKAAAAAVYLPATSGSTEVTALLQHLCLVFGLQWTRVYIECKGLFLAITGSSLLFVLFACELYEALSDRDA